MNGLGSEIRIPSFQTFFFDLHQIQRPIQVFLKKLQKDSESSLKAFSKKLIAFILQI